MKNVLRFAAPSVLAVAFIAGCNTDPAQGKTKAQVAEPAAVAQSAPAASAVRYAFSQADSKVEFVGAKITRKHDGSFGKFDGAIEAVGNDPTRSKVVVNIDVGSMTTDTEKLTGHLKSADFFDVEKFPKARFTSTSIRPGGENGATHTIAGNLELHGVTKAISFPATIRMGGGVVEVDSEFAINRKDFGLTYPGMPDDLIKDQVLLKLDVNAKPNAA